NRSTARPGTPRTVATSTTVGHVITAPPSTTGHGGSRVPPTTEPRSATRGQPSQPTCPDRVGESVPRRIRRRVLTPVALLVLTGPVRIIRAVAALAVPVRVAPTGLLVLLVSLVLLRVARLVGAVGVHTHNFPLAVTPFGGQPQCGTACRGFLGLRSLGRLVDIDDDLRVIVTQAHHGRFGGIDTHDSLLFRSEAFDLLHQHVVLVLDLGVRQQLIGRLLGLV